MCGRYVSSSRPDEIARYFDADVAEKLVDAPAPPGGTDGGDAPWANYNVAPTSDVLVVVTRGDHRLVDRFRWGLVPFWAKDLGAGAKMINARAETLGSKAAFKHAFRKRRCLIPADGFYEWKVVPGQKAKQPMYIHRVDGDRLAFAGLWEQWRPPEEDDGEAAPVRSCAIVTGRANELVAPIHDRMPVVLPPAAWEQWLDPDEQDLDRLAELLVPAPADLFVAEPVSTAVNNVRNQGRHLIEPVPVAGPDPAAGAP